MFAIIVSSKDPAGMNIKANLIRLFGFKEIRSYRNSVVYGNDTSRIFTIDVDTIHFEDCEKEIEADNYIFATRHQSKSGEKTLSMHFPGNLGKSEYGGQDNEVCLTDPILLKNAFMHLNEFGKDSGYALTLEATHHGPLIKKRPVFFIEIGSALEQWTDVNAGEIIARTIMKTIAGQEVNRFEIAIGFGGTHYCSGFNKLELKSDIALGHICAKYNIDNLDSGLIKRLMNSAPKIDYALLDWKGMDAAGREKVVRLLDEAGLKWKKTKEI